MKVEGLDKQLTVVGENMHCTRVFLRKGKRIGATPDGQDAILFPGEDGQQRYLVIPEKFKKTNDFKEGRVKHVQIAVNTAMAGQGDDAQVAMDYLRHVAQRQVDAGVDFLDVNTDEVSVKHAEQQEAMQWLVRTVQGMTDTPLSIDSSLLETISAGMSAYDAAKGRPMLNSASLERIEALDLAVEYRAHVVITGAGESGMPENTEQRVDNASHMIDLAFDKGIAPGDIHVDLLVFPISVDSQYGRHFLDAVRQIRDKYGPDIHITGGMSNVSFGLPARRLVNDVFVNLAIEAGADGGIIDPVARPIQGVVKLDKQSKGYQLARAMLMGEDMFCEAFITAFRAGELQHD